MNKSKYLKKLYRKLYFFGKQERQSIVDYYSEIIDDAVENGKNEELAVAELEPPEVIASKYRKQRKEEWVNSGKKIPTWFWIALIVGSPLWIGLFAGVIGIIVGIACAILGICVGFVVGGLCSVVYGLIVLFTDFGLGLLELGSGIFIFALGLLIVVGVVTLCKKIIVKIKSLKETNK